MQTYILILLAILVVLLVGVIYFGWRKILNLEIEQSRNKYDIEALRGLLSKILSEDNLESEQVANANNLAQLQQQANQQQMERDLHQQYKREMEQFEQNNEQVLGQQFNIPQRIEDTDVQTLESTDNEMPEDIESTVSIESLGSSDNEEDATEDDAEEEDGEDADGEEEDGEEDEEDEEEEEDATEEDGEDATEDDGEDATEDDGEDATEDDEEDRDGEEEEDGEEDEKENGEDEEDEEEEAQRMIERELELEEESGVEVRDEDKEVGDEPENVTGTDLEEYNKRLEEMLNKTGDIKKGKKVPNESAKKFEIGYKMVSQNDGNTYEVIGHGKGKKWKIVTN